ncbi:ferredoxin family protein [bacterium]|nr:ferredoxin family protein [bacterium]
MAYVVQESCVDCKYGDCVEVCPVNCFYEGEKMVYINPSECIDCDACLEECPVQAIAPDHEAEKKWIAINAEFDFMESLRRGAKENITHGSKWDKDVA